MAGFYAHHSLCWNSPLTGKDEFAGAVLEPAPTNDGSTFILTPAISCAPTLAQATPLTPAFTSFGARYIDKDLQKAI